MSLIGFGQKILGGKDMRFKKLKNAFFATVTAATLLASYTLPFTKISTASAETENKEATFELTIMHNNDTHAHLDNIAKTVTAVKQIREQNPDALLLHAGDVFTGTLYFHTEQGQADLEFMNLMEYDAMTFGNHEFDLGSSPEGHQALVDFIKGAKFPFVSANVDFSKDDKFTGIFNKSISASPENGQIYNGIIKEVNGEKVGIFGLTTEETASISSPDLITFTNYIEEAKKMVAEFENMGIDKIIAITHIGYNDNANVDNDLLLATNVDGIDVIVGGHSHTELPEPVIIDDEGKEEPTVIVQAGQYNNKLGLLDVVFDEYGKVIEANGQLLEINSYEEDPDAAELLAAYKEKVEEVSNEKIDVELKQSLENPRTGDEGNTEGISVRNSETILGNLITDGMLHAAKEYGKENNKDVIMALQNGGGIRAPIDAGPITVGEVITVLPFGNTLSVMDVTGAELKAAFEHSFNAYPGEFGGFLHIAGGKVEFDSTKPAGERVVAIYYLDENGNYVEIKEGETYTVATNYFTAQGGDGYEMFKKAFEENRVTDLGQSDWENFRNHLVRLGSEGIPTEIEGRIVDVSKLDESEKDQGNENNEPNDEENKQPGHGNDEPNNEEQSGDDNENQGKTDKNEQSQEVEKDKEKETETGKKLPNTATAMFNVLFAGIILIVVAGGIYFFNRRKSA